MAFLLISSILLLILLSRNNFNRKTINSTAREKTSPSGSPIPLQPSSQPSADMGKFCPIVIFTDGISAAVRIEISCRISDPIKYNYEAADPLGILSNLADARFRQLIQKFSFKEAKLKRKLVEHQLKKELQQQFKQYGIKLKSISIGSIQERH